MLADTPSRPDGVHALIDRIATALGAEATPERVERVARAVLQSGGTPAPSAGPRQPPEGAPLGGVSAQPPGSTRFVVTAYGHDTPGVLAALTAELAEGGVNVLDVSQKVLQGYFTVILIADLPGGGPDLGALRDRMQARGERFGARVLVQHEDLFQAMHRL